MHSVTVELAGASTAELVDALSTIATELAKRDAPESAAACLELTETLAAATDLQESAMAGFIGRVDAAGEHARWGYPSPKAWLRSRLGMRDNRAKDRLALARQRHRLPQVAQRLAAGELSIGYATTIADSVARLDDIDCAQAETLLLEMADEGFSAGKVAAFGSRIRDVIAERDGTEDAPDEDTRRGYAKSWLTTTRSLDGGRYVKGWLNPEDAAIWDGTLAPLAKPAGLDDRRDLGERTAAALSGVLSGGHKATKVTVICDLDTLTGGNAPPGSSMGRRSLLSRPAASPSRPESHRSCWARATPRCTWDGASGSRARRNGGSWKPCTPRVRCGGVRCPAPCAKWITFTDGRSADRRPISISSP
ncbi:DUF222 domain-containing protein [Spirillospora sp. NPDC000708]